MIPAAQELTQFVKRVKRIAVVSGAGVSTGWGIPDYRDRNGNWKHERPVRYAQFIGSPAVRQRYWARSFMGWSRIADAGLDEENISAFNVPDCDACGGVVKRDVVFFGENVPRERVALAVEATDRADALLVVGSSLMVFSGYRFARHVAQSGKPLAIVNRGRTRADDIATLKIDADCEDVLAHVSDACV